MKKLLFSVCLILGILGNLTVKAQQATTIISFKSGKNPGESLEMPVRKVAQQGEKDVLVEYSFEGATRAIKEVNEVQYDFLHVEGFGLLSQVGKPALPMHNDMIALPIGSEAKIEILETEYMDYEGFYIHPALKPAYDIYGGDEPEFEIDSVLYSTNAMFPEEIVEITNIQITRGVPVAMIQVKPVQFNPVSKKIRVYSKITYRLHFIAGAGKTTLDGANTNYANLLLKNIVINPVELDNISEATKSIKASGDRYDYIIITTPEFEAMADTLARWKNQLGYTVEIVSKYGWTSNEVKDSVHIRYNAWSPRPDYLLIIGDHEDVPGELLTTGGYGTWATDLYYVCMDGASDFYPDMARGRISVSDAAEAEIVINKIINYEKNPPANTRFYDNTLHCAYFQHAGGGYAERRFAQTAEEALQYVSTTQTKNVHRVYYTEPSVTPTNWNNGYYSAGEPIPSYLLKPGFAWDGDNLDIISRIDSGSLYVLHRDHGDVTLWGDPYFSTTDINNLNNGDLLPIVFSLNCLTGKYYSTECFSEAFIRKQNGGSVGVFGMANVSMSGYNDAIGLGIFDAIWASPGLVANFTGSASTTGTLTPHGSIYTMGDVLNQSLIRMDETWGDGWGYSQYEHELFHYFGDPAMRMWTNIPDTMEAVHDDTLNCGTTSINVSSPNCSEGLATIYFNNKLIGKTYLSGGTGTILLDEPLYDVSDRALLTISEQNFVPYIAEIFVKSNCTIAPVTKFNIESSTACSGEAFQLTDKSYFSPTSWDWKITPEASVTFADTCTSSSRNPRIIFNDPGTYTIRLITSNVYGSDTLIKTNIVEVNDIVADFKYSGSLCTSDIISFQDNSSCNPTSWEWTITPNTCIYTNGTDSLSQNPDVIFQNAGTYSIKLKAFNSFGIDSITKSITLANELIIGTDKNGNLHLPIEPYYGYSYSQTIYENSDIGSGKVITKIYYDWTGTNTWSDAIVVYMGHTTKTEYSGTTDWIPISEFTEVYNGFLSVTNTPGWIEIPLTTPFVYNGTDNLVIAVEENTPGYHSSSDDFYCTQLNSLNNSIYFYNDGTNPDPLSPPSGTLSPYTPNLKITFTPPGPMVFDSLTVLQPNTTNILSGSTNQEIIRIKITTEGITDPLYVKDMYFTTTGCTNTSDIDSAIVFYTGNSSVFSQTNKVGNTIISPSGVFSVSDSISLGYGNNYFWLTYSIKGDTSLAGNLLDAACDSVLINDEIKIPDISDPAGYRSIFSLGGPVTLPWIEDFENAGPIIEYTTSEQFINGIPWWEYSKTEIGRLRFQAGSGFIYNGTQSATIDASISGTYSTNFLILTLNLSKYTGSDDLDLSFYYMDHGDEDEADDKVWIRGSNGDPWIEVYDLAGSSSGVGIWQHVTNIDIDDFLNNSGQSVTATFQIRLGQYDNFPATSTTASDGFTFDDILISGTIPAPMSFVSTYALHSDTSNVIIGRKKQNVLGVCIETSGGLDRMNATKLYLTTHGTDELAAIDSARLYYSGTNSNFSTKQQFGEAIANPSGTLIFEDTALLWNNKNYFWLTYNIDSNVNYIGNIVDATFDSVVVSDTTRYPAISNPAGSRTIDTLSVEWTWMLYLYEDGTGLDGADDINEWEAAGSVADKINYIILYDANNDAEDGIYYVEQDPGGYNSTIISSIVSTELGTDPDMNDWQTLRDFANWTRTNYPAQHYGLTVWDHGSGIFDKEGLFPNKNPEEGAVGNMHLWEMDKALEDFVSVEGKKIDIIGYDVCLLGQIETVYQMKDLGNYIIASEKTEPGDGWDYVASFMRLNANPKMPADSLAMYIVNDYVTSYNFGSQGYDVVTQAATSIDLLANVALPALNDFADTLIAYMRFYKNNYLTAINNAWIADYNPDHKDIIDFAEIVSSDTSLPASIRTAANEAIVALNSAIIAEGHIGTATDGANGLKAWMPEDITIQGIYETYYMDTTNYLRFSKTHWDEFLYGLTQEFPMQYVSSTTTQQNSMVLVGAPDQKIIGIEIITGGTLSPINSSSFVFNTNGTTNIDDINSASLFYTGTSNSFNRNNQVGNMVSNPNGSFTINCSQLLEEGTNYFWLAYTIADDATEGNYADAECTEVTVDGTSYTPVITAPSGNQQIISLGGPVTLPWIEDFENAGPIIEYTTNEQFINGIPWWEYSKTENGRLRFQAGSGFIHNGLQSATIDASVSGTYSTNYLILTLNLSNYNGANDLELSFYYMDHGDENEADDKVWIRGCNSDTWIEVYDLAGSSTGTGVWQYVSNIDIDNVLSSNGQIPTASFQIRLGQYDNYPATSTTASDGFTFDDIMISGTIPGPMVYQNSFAFHPTLTDACVGEINSQILGIVIEASGNSDPLPVESLQFSTTGTYDVNDIESARLYYSGNSNNFSIIQMFGVPEENPSGTFEFVDSIILLSGNNYFWLVYDVTDDTSSVGNNLDAECNQIEVDDNVEIPSIAAPAGNRTIAVCNGIILPWIEDFEDIGPVTTFTSNTNEINGSTYWSYDKTNLGRLRFQIDSTFTSSGNKAVTMDSEMDDYYSSNHLIATLNLSRYASSTNLFLSFNYMEHGDETHDSDMVWIRGSETDAWIGAYYLDPTVAYNGVYNYITNIDIDSLLGINGQQPTETFQLKLGQYDNYMATSITATDGITFDDIMIFEHIDDIIMANPENQLMCTGDTAVFNILVTSSYPVSYQWFKNSIPLTGNSNILGTKTNTLTLCNVQQPDTGHYSCIATTIKSVMESDPALLVVTNPPASPTVLDKEICYGVISSVTASGSNIKWYSNNACTNLLHEGTSYSLNSHNIGTINLYVTQSQMGCMSSASVCQVTVYPLPEVFLGNDTTVNPGCVLTLNAGDGFTSYRWNDETTISTHNFVATTGNPGKNTCFVVVVDGNTCTGSDTIIITVKNPDGIEDNLSANSIRIHPNPSKGSLLVEIKGITNTFAILHITSTTGVEIYNNKVSLPTGNEIIEIDLTDQPNGAYFLNILLDKQEFNRIILLQK
ncbi:MAG: hypothetical protein JXB49_35895 [Bacteroidales bacterium]|nr:hypothetical protein [Bacteroidales bacterium]